MTRFLRALRLVTIPAMAVAWLGPIASAEAARINILNCTETTVKICTLEESDTEIVKPDKVKHFSCKANCKFRIIECAGNGCGNCTEQAEGRRMNHSFGRGDYLLVGLEKSNGDDSPYKSSNLVEGTICPAPVAPQQR